MIVDYLKDEVISPQPSEILDVLAGKAMLERFCAPLCDTLLACGIIGGSKPFESTAAASCKKPRFHP